MAQGPGDNQKQAGRHWGRSSHFLAVIIRTVNGTIRDGPIHAGNLAYLSMLALFPFFILGAAIFSLFGEVGEREAMITAILAGMPAQAALSLEPVAHDVMNAREGWLLWIGAAIALWTVSSLIETIRSILRRAYEVEATQPFWKYRLASIGVILASVILLMFSLVAQVAIGATEQVIASNFPQLMGMLPDLRTTKLVPTLGLFGSFYLLFLTLTPAPYRARAYPKWPGALFITIWWLAVTSALPPLLRSFFSYSLTYGSLAGIIITLLFFWLIGLAVVIGAELNAALAKTNEESTLEEL